MSQGEGLSFLDAFYIVDAFYELMLRYGGREIVAANVRDGEGEDVGWCYIGFIMRS